MSSVALWVKPGVGPTLKAFTDDYADPDDLSWMDVPNDDYASFLFNSEIEELAYAYKTLDYTFDGPSLKTHFTGTWSRYLDPPGSTEANCSAVVYGNENATNDIIYGWLCYDHLNPYPYRTILWQLQDNSNWRSVWECVRQTYIGSSDKFYLSHNLNDVPTTTASIKKDTTWATCPSTTSGAGRLLRGDIQEYLYSWIYSWWNTKPDFAGGKNGVQSASNIIVSELPIEDDPYPAVSGVYTEGVNTLLIDPTVPIAKMAKAGFDAATATDDQCIFSSSKIPMKLAKTGSFTLAAGASITIPIDYPVSTKCLVDYQVNVTGQTLLVPPYPDNNVDEIKLQHKISGGSILFQNISSVSLDCRYFVLTMDGQGQSSGSAPIFDLDPTADSIIRVAGTAGTNDADIILDKRCAYLPVVAQGWVAAADMVASDKARYGNKMYTVDLTNTGFKPYVIARAKFGINNDSGRYVWQDFLIKNIEIYDYFSASSFLAKVTDTQIKFYANTDQSRAEDANRQDVGYQIQLSQSTLIGFRYYVLAVPTSL